MLKFNNYVRTKTLQEAYDLSQKKSNVVIGGMLWLKMQDRTAQIAIDLCDLGLNEIIETDSEIHIGAMVTLRDLEKHKTLNEMTNFAVRDSMKYIVGVQFRNVATVGGSVFGKFGFSDVLTLLLAMNAKVELFAKGIVTLSEFLEMPSERDILVKIIVPKQKLNMIYTSQRNTKTHFPTVALAMVFDGENFICSVGARPSRAKVVTVSKNTAENVAQEVIKALDFSGNALASADYRQHLARVLIIRTVAKFEEKVEV